MAAADIVAAGFAAAELIGHVLGFVEFAVAEFSAAELIVVEPDVLVPAIPGIAPAGFAAEAEWDAQTNPDRRLYQLRLGCQLQYTSINHAVS